MEQDSMEYDIIIVGAGPSGLTAAIKLKQLAKENQQTINICILEKGAQVGAHIISGAVLNPCVLKHLLPNNWEKAPLDSAVLRDEFYFLTKKKTLKIPTPKPLRNDGNYIISLSDLCIFLASEAEALGCEIYPGFVADKVLYNSQNQVVGISTGAVGLDKNKKQTPQYQPGIKIYAKQTIFAEGCRGHLSQQIIHHFKLNKNKMPQTYGLGIKEIWEIDSQYHQQGKVIHTIGFPLPNDVYGGSFLYHFSNNRISLGLVAGLDYANPYLNPFQKMQILKTHPYFQNILKGAKRLSYGARAIVEGGIQALPQLTFPGGVLVGDGAGFLNVPKIKGIHTAMQSGILAAQSIYKWTNEVNQSMEVFDYQSTFDDSELAKELYQVRNIRPAFKYGLIPGLIYAFFDTYVFKGALPWTLKTQNDHTTLKFAQNFQPDNYKFSEKMHTFDKLSSVYLTNTNHQENQPCHLVLKDRRKAIDINYKYFASPETYYCPAQVYEIVKDEKTNTTRLVINSQNCIHCKTCDIKDPTQNIFWCAPQGGDGPNYQGM